MNSQTISHFSDPKRFGALCGEGFSLKGHGTTSDNPSCWMCWAAAEKLPYEQKPKWHTVKMNGRYYMFQSFADAVGFSVKWNGLLLTPICNA